MKTVSRRGFFAALTGKRPAEPPPPPAARELAGLVAPGQVFSLEDFYAARAARRADEKKDGGS